MTPREIVSELDRYIVGQRAAKRAVAIALRNRWRRQQVPEELRDEIAPKNIIMIGPTGVGKTEISRRLAKLANAPFLKVEASKFTEVGYVGRDVESIIRDLTDLAVNMVKEEEKQKVEIKAREVAEERVLDLLLPTTAESIDGEAVDPDHAAGARGGRDTLGDELFERGHGPREAQLVLEAETARRVGQEVAEADHRPAAAAHGRDGPELAADAVAGSGSRGGPSPAVSMDRSDAPPELHSGPPFPAPCLPGNPRSR